MLRSALIFSITFNIVLFNNSYLPSQTIDKDYKEETRMDSSLFSSKLFIDNINNEEKPDLWPISGNEHYYRGIMMKSQFGAIDLYRVEWPDYSKLFSAKDQQYINQIAGKPNANAASVQSLAPLLNTPEKVSAFLAWKFIGGHAHNDKKPISMIRDLKGVCYDQHIFASWALNQAGYEAHCITYISPIFGGHTVTVFRDKNNGWNLLEFGRITWIGAHSMEKALTIAIPDGIRFWDTPAINNPDDNKGTAFHHVIETPSGIALKNFMNGVNGCLPISLGQMYALEPVFQENFQNRFYSTNSAFGGTFKINNIQLDSRVWYSNDPMLKTTIGSALRWSSSWIDQMSTGILIMPNAYGLSVISRYYEQQPMTVFFFNLQKRGCLYTAILDSGHRFTFDDDYDIRLNLAPTYTNQISPDISYQLSYFDITSRSRINFHTFDNINLFISGTIWLSMTDMLAYWLENGNLQGTPKNAFVETGMSYEKNQFRFEANLYQPICQYTNMLADVVCWRFSGSTKLGSNLELSAELQGRVNSKFIGSIYGGIEWNGISFGSGFSHWMEDGSNYFFQLSTDLTKVL